MTDELSAVRARVQGAGVSGSPGDFLRALKDGGFQEAEFYAADSQKFRRRYCGLWIDGELLRGIFCAESNEGTSVTKYAQPLSALGKIRRTDSLEHTEVPAYFRRTFIIPFDGAESIKLDGGRTDALDGTPVSKFIAALEGR